MTPSFSVCDARAREAADEAVRATLDQVRDRALRSEKTWRALADRARRLDIDRVEAERIRAERRAP